MSKVLPLKRGSILVVRADIATVKGGLTNPHDLEVLVKREVQVHSLKNLHAKIYVAGGKAFVGSMNASSLSFDGKLAEAAVEIRESRAVAAAKLAVLAWALGPSLTLEDLEELKAIYKPRRDGPKNIRKPGNEELELPQLRILRTRAGRWEKHTQQRFDEDAPALRKEAAADKEAIRAVEWVGTPPKIFKDMLDLEIRRKGRDLRVHPPSRLRRVTGTQKGKSEKLVYLSSQQGSRTKLLSKILVQLGSQSRLARHLRGRGRRITSPEDIQRILSIWSPRK
jgi:hypothetical protein